MFLCAHSDSTGRFAQNTQQSFAQVSTFFRQSESAGMYEHHYNLQYHIYQHCAP